jgi:PAS domain S-box-containing protein
MTSPSGKGHHASALVAEHFLAPPQRIPGSSHEKPVLPYGWAFYPVQLALLAAVYFGAAKLGLSMAFVAEQVTAVWPPTGIALAALLMFGYRHWPGIALGAFLANATANAPLAPAMGIALGNTLEALAGAWMLRRLIRFDSALGRVEEVLGLVLLAAGLSTMISATIGVTSLCLGGVKPWEAYREMWSVWWLGDAMGDLVVAPLLLTWSGWHRIRWRPRRVVELGILLLALVAVSLSVFCEPFVLLSHPALVYSLFPFMIWAALRFRPRTVSLAIAVASAIATWGTVHGFGAFHAPTTEERLILLQLYMGVVAITTLLLAAVMAERGQSSVLVRAVVDGTTDAVFVKNRQGRYLMINAAGAGFLGRTVAEVIGKDDTELLSPETARAFVEGDRRVLATGEVQTIEEVGAAAGVTRTYLATKAPYRDAQENVIGVIGISRDITERKVAEDRFRQVVESAPNGLVMINHEGRIVLVNEQTEKLFGYRRDELLGQPVEVLLPDRFRGEHPGHRANFFAYPTRRPMGVGRELYGRSRDGREFPVEIGLAPIETAEGLLVLSVIVDITERNKAAAARSRLAAIVESSEDAILSRNLDGVILTWNRAAEKMFGYPADEIVGRHISVLFPPELAGEMSVLLEQLRRGERRDIHETVRLRKDGTRIDVSLSISPMPEANGRLTAASVIARDITERKRIERRLATEHGVTIALAESDTLEGAAPKVLKTVGETLGCDLGVLWEVGIALGMLRCVAVWRPPGIEVTDFEKHSRQFAFARGEGLPGRAWDSGQPVWVPDAPFPRSVAAHRNGPCSAIAFPLRSNGDVLGVIEFFSPELRQPQEAVFAMMASIGDQVVQFIERRKAEMVLHSRAREFQLARAIQQGLLPKAPPVLAGFAIAGATHPTQETGGDYYDFIPMSDGHWGIAIGDASGHGIGAALLISETRAYLRALALTHTDPGTVLRLLNYRLAEDMSTDHFVTVLFARLCPLTRSLVYSNAGHWPGYVLDAQGEVKLVLNSTNLPLGLDPTGDFSNGPPITLDPGDLVFLLSDGIVEAPSANGSPFNLDRAIEVVRAHRHHPPGELVAALLDQVREWSQSALADDMTAVVIKVQG